ncbi:MAG: rod shape-determining protein MreD [Bacteroidetes bacterium]|nr:MAG: rod shape-determining protein MreD [Bacteroidota bacterium]
MINEIIKNTIRFLFLVLFQVLVLNNIQLSGYLNPFLYVLFVLMLPFQTPKWMALLLAFIAGISVDMFSDTGGMHAAASVFMAFMRDHVLKLISPREGYDAVQSPTVQQFGFGWFFSYAGILILVHHFILFYMEAFHFSGFFSTLFRVILSSLFSLTIVFISQFFFFRPKS